MKPELGTARLFLWFDLPGCPAGPPTSAHPEDVPSWHPSATPLSPGRVGITGARARVLGGGVAETQRCQRQGHGKGTEGKLPHGRGEGGHRQVERELAEGDKFW